MRMKGVRRILTLFSFASVMLSLAAGSAVAKPRTSESCPTCGRGKGAEVSIPGLIDLEKASAPACAKHSVLDEILENKGQCSAQFACNLIRSIPDAAAGLYSSVGGFIASLISESKSTQKRSCFDARGGSCSGEIWATIFRDVLGVTDMAKNLATKVADWGIQKIKNWYNDPKLEIKTLQDKTANAAHFMRTLNRDKLKSYAVAGASWPVKFAKDLVTSYANFLKETYSCSRWEGAPHYSQCLQRSSTISCMSCNDLINASCGIIGGFIAEGKLLAFVATRGIGFWKDTKLLRSIRASEKSGLLAKAEESSIETQSVAAKAITQRLKVLKAVDTSDVTPELTTKIKNTFRRSHARLKRTLIEKDPGFAALAAEKQERLTTHIIHQMQLEKNLSASELNAQLEKMMNSCAMR